MEVRRQRQVVTGPKRTAAQVVEVAASNAFGCEGPGRNFKEGASFNVTRETTTKRMVQKQCVRQVPYMVNEIVEEKQIKRVPAASAALRTLARD